MIVQNEVGIFIEKFKNGDNDSFVNLMNCVKNDLYRVIFAIIQNEQNSLEVFQEVTYKAFLNLKRLKQSQFFKTWITRIAINESRNFIKKNSKIVYLSEYDEQSKIQDNETKLDFEKALNTFDINTKSVLVMKLYLDYTFQEISKTLEKSESTIKSIYYTSLEKLKELLHE